MDKAKGISLEFKHSVLKWNYEDKDKPRTSHAAEKHFSAKGQHQHTGDSWLAMETQRHPPRFRQEGT
jgi:hypothetical protein